MAKKTVIAILAIFAAIGIVFAASGGTGNNNPKNDSSDQIKQQDVKNSSSNISTDTKTKTGISAAKAQKIAQKYIQVSGAVAGTPKLTKIKGHTIYIVPVIDNGKTVGEIDIDAQSGENVGGAGGI